MEPLHEEEALELVDGMEAMMGEMAHAAQEQAAKELEYSLVRYIKKNRHDSTFKGWIAESDPESVRINPRLRYADSHQLRIWNNSEGVKTFGLSKVGVLSKDELHDDHALCGWPPGPKKNTGSAKKRKQKRKSRRVKKEKKRKTRRGRK